MLTRRTLTVWTGIILLSSMFLMGQNPPGWSPSDVLYCQDLDGDGYGVVPALLCPYAFYLDCDDSRPDVNPGRTEASYGDTMCMDGLDNDCDGAVDSQDNGCQQCTFPADCDDANPCTNDDCVGSVCQYTNNTLPCEDLNPCTMNDTCSQGVCDGVPLDADGDTYVSGVCPGGNDCLDSNPNVNPGEIEGPAADPTCSDTLDNDCDGLTDAAEDPGCA